MCFCLLVELWRNFENICNSTTSLCLVIAKTRVALWNVIFLVNYFIKKMQRYLPTYRLDSKHPYNKEECETLLRTVLDTSMEGFVYEPDEAESLAKSLSSEIMVKLKKLNFDRFVYFVWTIKSTVKVKVTPIYALNK